MTSRRARQHWYLATVLLGLWLMASSWVVPAVIRSAYEDGALGFLGWLLPGRGSTPVERYLAVWNHVARLAAWWLVLAWLVVGAVLYARRILRSAAPADGAGSTPTPQRPAGFILLACAFGLLAGVGEGAYLFGQTSYLHQVSVPFPWVSEQVVWMAPLAAVSLFGLAALGIRLCRQLIGPKAEFRVSVFVLASLWALDWVMMTGWIHIAAAVVLSLGVGSAVVRLAEGRPSPFSQLLRRGTAILAVAVFVAAVAVNLGLRIRERVAVADLPDAPNGARNVLLIVLDTERAQSLGLYGHPRPTSPRLEAFARDAVVFDMAFSPASWTLPSHASMFTGRHPGELRVAASVPLDDRYPTLAETLAGSGYVTGGFVANIYFACSLMGIGRGFVHYDDDEVSVGMTLTSFSLARDVAGWIASSSGYHQDLVRRRASEINRRFLTWLSTLDPDRPFFAFINYFDAHAPYRAPRSFRRGAGYPDGLYWHSRGDQAAGYSKAELEQLSDSYDEGIAYADHELGQLLDALDESGVLDNTLVIVTADHGEAFGEHRWVGHGDIYRTTVGVPLVIRDPSGMGAGLRVPRPVGLRNIPATIVDLLKLPHSPFPGRSFATYWTKGGTDPRSPTPLRADPGARDDIIASWGPNGTVSLVAGALHYIEHTDRPEELFDLLDDPWERSDLAGRADYRPALERFRTYRDALPTDGGSTP